MRIRVWALRAVCSLLAFYSWGMLQQRDPVPGDGFVTPLLFAVLIVCYAEAEYLTEPDEPSSTGEKT